MRDDADISGLVPLAARGDRAAASQLLAAIHPPIVRYCRARMGSDGHTAPEDIAQEVCLAVLSALPGYEDRGRPFMAFVYGIAAHKVADAHRSGGRDLSQAMADVPDQISGMGTPEEDVLSAASSNDVRRLLDALNDRSRDIVILRVFEGLSAEETGAIIGTTPGAVRVAQHRALMKMRAIIEREAEETR
ncbi:RNA polymerase sigma factor ShbA [Corynebacterium sp. TAE3-ERU12]|uniref:RNA polymerase sigma factor ShbA n=1 Tax=Corynebacterium sp. TAE3-ERU12 TaxID=2849491 RepID=UPI001C47D4D5|nr:RNA polymerase sigma factor ShbA [Corynebacterium sp. TAE3-ERU12]MBV7294727.1 RNA polymerase sigma factor ShbA [Corynebacterium sp. TAE3-ERU12]